MPRVHTQTHIWEINPSKTKSVSITCLMHVNNTQMSTSAFNIEPKATLTILQQWEKVNKQWLCVALHIFFSISHSVFFLFVYVVSSNKFCGRQIEWHYLVEFMCGKGAALESMSSNRIVMIASTPTSTFMFVNDWEGTWFHDCCTISTVGS